MERRVELFAHRRDKAQRAAEEEERDSDSDNSHMDFEAYEELDDEDDGVVDYAWKSRDELLKQWQEQQEKKPPLPPLPEPSCADEASLLLAQCSPARTPQEVKRLLEARANPDIVVATETWGSKPPLYKFINLGKTGYVPTILYARAQTP